MSLQEELNFLEKMSIKAAGGSKCTQKKVCPHSEEISNLYIEKEHFFFKQGITDEERHNAMLELNEAIQNVTMVCICDKA